MSELTAKQGASSGGAWHCVGIVAMHALIVGAVIWGWGTQWLPQYLAFHIDKGYLNPDLLQWIEPWLRILALGVVSKIALGMVLLMIDYLIVGLLMRSRYLSWFTDYWSVIVIGAPLLCVCLTGTKMLESYWSLQERIDSLRHRTVQQRGQDFHHLIGTWTLIGREKQGVRKSLPQSGIELVIGAEEYCWRGENGDCMGGWNVYSSSDKNEMSFVPNEMNENAWGGQGYYRVTTTRLGLHLVNEPGFFELKDFDSRTGGELWIFKRSSP